LRTSYARILVAVIITTIGCFSCAPAAKHTRIQPRTQFTSNLPSVKGPSLYNQGKYQEALPHLQRWAQTDPNNWLSHNWLGNNYLPLKRYDEAIAELQKANAIKKDKSNFNGLGQCYYHKGLYDEALGYFRMWVELDNTNWLSHNWLGNNYLQLKRYDEAIAEFQKANAIKKDKSNFNGLGQCYYHKGLYDEALGYFRMWVELDNTNWVSHHWLGWNYLQLKRYDEAIAELQKANAIKKDSGNFNGLGQCYYHKGLYDEALGYFRMWVELDNTNWVSHNWLGYNYLQLKRYDEAIAEFQKANAIKKDSVNFRALGQCYYKLGKYDHAIELLESGLDISPDLQKRDFKFELAMCYLAKGDDGKASQLLEGRQILGVQTQKHEKGIKIVDVYKNAPADRAGLKPGDTLTEISSEPLAGVSDKRFTDEFIPRTDQAEVKFLRQGRIHTATIQMNLRLVKRVEPKTIIIEGPGFAGEKWAVIIGVSKYKDSRIPCLRYASKDAQSLYNWLISENGGRYSPSRVKLLADESATTRNIKNALFGWLKQAIAEDMVIVYFAGHGSPPSPDEPENLFLLSYDTDFDMISSTGFPMWDVETALKRFIKAERVVVIADACHAGGVGSAFIQGRRAITIKPTTATALQSLTNVGKGIAVITASDDKQLSQEGKQWGGGHGVFTYHLLNGLNGEADYNNDNMVTLGELIPYLSQSVRRSTKNAQSPTVAGRFDPALTLKK